MMTAHELTKPGLLFHLRLQESSPDTSKLPRFSVPFIPSVIGAGPVTITLQVYNREERDDNPPKLFSSGLAMRTKERAFCDFSVCRPKATAL